MLYLLSNQANTLCVTWTERYTSTDSPYVILELKSALNEVLSFSLLKAANTSQHTERYDLFAITLPETDKGQYTYTVYESATASVADKTAVIETGLAFVEYGEDAGVAWDASIDYVAFGADAPTPMIVDTPVIQPNAGTYAGFVTLTMTCATAGSRIYYTTDGTIPTSQNGTLYDGDNKPVITSSALVLARAYADGMQFSALASSSFVVTPVTLTAIPSGGTFLRSTPPTVVLVSNSETAEIYTTTNGDDPTVLDTPYAPITPTVITRWKGRAFDPPAAPSNIVDETYNIQATAPTLDTDSGTYISSRTITATNTNPSGTNEYSVDGGAYVAGDSVLIEQSSVVAFRTVASGVYVASEPTTINVEIQCAAPTIVPDGATFEEDQEVTITTNEISGTTHYTIDGSTPTQSDPTTVPFDLTATATVKARTFRAGTTPSIVVESFFAKAFRPALAGRNNARIYLSENSFATWDEIQPLGNTNQAWRHAQIGDSGLYAQVGTLTEMRYSVDQLQTWLTPTFPSPLLNLNRMNATKSGDKVVVIANIGNSRNQVLRSLDGGATFVDVSPNAATFNGAAYSPDGTKLYCTKLGNASTNINDDVIYFSTDDGATWTTTYAENNRVALYLSVSNTAIYFALQSGIGSFLAVIKSIDSGITQTNLTSILGTNLYRVPTISGDDSLLTVTRDSFGSDTIIKKSLDQGATFTDYNLPASVVVNVNAMSFDGNRVMIGTNGRIYGSLDKLATPMTEISPIANNNWQLAACIS